MWRWAASEQTCLAPVLVLGPLAVAFLELVLETAVRRGLLTLVTAAAGNLGLSPLVANPAGRVRR